MLYLYDRTLKRADSPGPPDRILAIPAGVTAGPLVSCLMVTRGNPALFASAINGFRRQTYRNRELVAVCDAVTPELQQLAADAGAPVRFVEAGAGLSLGQLRNLSVEAARGELVCQWDDDDLYSPSRLSLGIGALLGVEADALFLRQWTIWAPAQHVLAISGTRAWEGTMIARRAALLPYTDLRRGEDTVLVDTMARQSVMVLMDDPLGYCYCIHGNNTFASSHMQAIIRAARLTFDYERALGAFSGAFDFAAHPALSAADRQRLVHSSADRSQPRRLDRYMRVSQLLRRLRFRSATR